MQHKIISHQCKFPSTGFSLDHLSQEKTHPRKRNKIQKECLYYAMSIGNKAHAKTSTTPDKIKICQDNPGTADTVSSLPYYQDKFHHQVHLVPEWYSLFCAHNLSQEWCASDVCQENYIWVQLSI
jgi:hypothetical protein